MNLTALDKFLEMLRMTGKMPIKTALKKTGGQIARTGRAVRDNPRAALGGAAGGGALAAFLKRGGGEEEELGRLLINRSGEEEFDY